jgi:hypothetical protein
MPVVSLVIPMSISKERFACTRLFTRSATTRGDTHQSPCVGCGIPDRGARVCARCCRTLLQHSVAALVTPKASLWGKPADKDAGRSLGRSRSTRLNAWFAPSMFLGSRANGRSQSAIAVGHEMCAAAASASSGRTSTSGAPSTASRRRSSSHYAGPPRFDCLAFRIGHRKRRLDMSELCTTRACTTPDQRLMRPLHAGTADGEQVTSTAVSASHSAAALRPEFDSYK